MPPARAGGLLRVRCPLSPRVPDIVISVAGTFADAYPVSDIYLVF